MAQHGLRQNRLAIRGDGLFVVRTPNGDRYTRDGAFSFNAKGELVNASGHQVLTDQGVFRLTNTETNFAVAQDGQITTSEGQRGRIRLVQVADPQSLRNTGANEFSSTAQARPADAKVWIEPGAVEKSNVNAIREMSRLIEISRAYQSVATMMGQTDQLRREAIQKLADVSA